MTKVLKTWIAIAPVLVGLLPVTAQAQEMAGQPSVGMASPVFASAGASADYRVGAGDMLGISVYRSPEMSTQIPIDIEGAIIFPELGRILVRDMTAAEIASILQIRLRRAGILVNPILNVVVTQLRAKRVSVMGAVGHPGEYALDREGLNLSQVLAMAGANFGTGDAVVTVIEGTGQAALRTQTRIASSVSGKDDRPVKNGQVIVVQAAPLFYVTGEVGHPGAFPLQPGMTIYQAIAVAGGATTRGSIHRLRLTRESNDGAGRDVPSPKLGTLVAPNDVVTVKTRIF